MFSFLSDIYFWYFLIGSCVSFSISHYANFLKFSWKHSFGRYMNWCIFCFTVAVFLNNGILAGIFAMILQTFYYYLFFPMVFLILNNIGLKFKIDVTQLIKTSTNHNYVPLINNSNQNNTTTKNPLKTNSRFQIFTITPITIIQDPEIFGDRLIKYMTKDNKENYEIKFVGFSDDYHIWENKEVRSFMEELDLIFPYWFYYVNKKTYSLMNITYSLSEYQKVEGQVVFNINSLTSFSENHYNHLVPLWKQLNIANGASVREVTENTCNYYHKHYKKEEFYYLEW